MTVEATSPAAATTTTASGTTSSPAWAVAAWRCTSTRSGSAQNAAVTTASGLQRLVARSAATTSTGGPNQPSNVNFTGSIDDVAFYSAPLTAAQIANHYTTGTTAAATCCRQRRLRRRPTTWWRRSMAVGRMTRMARSPRMPGRSVTVVRARECRRVTRMRRRTPTPVSLTVTEQFRWHEHGVAPDHGVGVECLADCGLHVIVDELGGVVQRQRIA